MSSGLYSGASGLALGVGLYAGNPGLWGGAAGLITGDGASLYLDFLAGAPLDSRITFTRGSNATLVDSTGKIVYAPANLLLRSEEFDSGTWSKSNSTVTANATAAPDGTTTADKLVESATSNIHYASQSITALSPASNSYMVSSYVKAGERSYVTLGLSDISVGSRYAVAVFNLDTGATMTTGAQGTGYAVSNATAVAVGNGWYRCSVYCTAGTTVSFLAAAVGVNKSGVITGTTAGGFESYAGDGVSGIFVWGAQLEPVTYQTTPSTYVATTSAVYYGPRFDYDPVTLAAKGLLIEESRSNVCIQSADIDNVAWSSAGVGVVGDTVISPAGTTTGNTITCAAGSSLHRVISTAGVVILSTSITHSVFVKAGTHSFFQIHDGSTGTYYANFDLTTGTVTVVNPTSGATITSYGNGWYKCTLSFTSGAATSIGVIAIIPDGTSLRNPTWTAAGTESIYAWGYQIEAGSFATSYIPTVASTVTRSADVATMTGTNFSSWYNQAQGAFVVSVSTPYVTPSSAYLFSAGNAAEDSGIYSLINSSSNVIGNVVAGGVSQASMTTSTVTANTAFKTAIAAQINNFAAVLNGGTVATDTAGTMPTVDRLTIGNRATSGRALNGHIRTIAYYNTRLPNATLQALTA